MADPRRFKPNTHTKTRIYECWANMRKRCNNPRSQGYSAYGGRGITICIEWDDFDIFYDWAMAAGYSDELTIDRIDNDGGYSPDNCQWATSTMQGRNRRNTVLTVEDVEAIRADTRPVQEIADDYGLKSKRSVSQIKNHEKWKEA